MTREQGPRRGAAEDVYRSASALLHNAGHLPAPGVMIGVGETLCDRAGQHRVATLTLRKSRHIASLAPCGSQAAQRRGLPAWILGATPAEKRVDPQGGVPEAIGTDRRKPEE